MRGKIGEGEAAKIYLVSFALMLLAAIPVGLLLRGDTYLFVAYALPQVCFLGMVFLFAGTKNIPFPDLVPVKKSVKPAALALTLLVTLGLFLQNLILAVGFQWLLDASGIPAEVKVPDLADTRNLVLAILIMCALPALGEEFLYRGAALSSMRGRRGFAAALFSAAFFALSHGNLAQLVHQFFLGFVLAYITLQTGTIWYAVCAHFFNNLFAILLPLLLPAFDALGVYSVQNALIMVGLSAAGIAILYPSLALLIRSAGGGRYPRLREFVFDKSAPACYNDTDEAGTAAVRGKVWNIVLFLFLLLQLIINTVVSALPALNQLIS